MAQYIDKSALVAEIERMQDAYIAKLESRGMGHEESVMASISYINGIKDIIDTLEVREVEESKLTNPRFPHLNNIVDKVFGTGNLESFEHEEAEQLVLLAKEELLKDLEVKEVCMSALDNGNMPVERWKEACKAASCQANYRKSKGLTETCDDYFVDGVQWADEHPIKMKEVDLDDKGKWKNTGGFGSTWDPDSPDYYPD